MCAYSNRDCARRLSPENAMPDIKIVTEVAGRVCALPIEVGGSVGDGDDVAFVEAMKMEIPVASPAAGKLKSRQSALKPRAWFASIVSSPASWSA